MADAPAAPAAPAEGHQMADAPAAPAAPAEPEMIEGQHNPFVNSLLSVAQRLDDEGAALGKKVAGNRSTLRAMRDQKLMSDEQAKAVEAFYPTRERKVKDKATDDKTFAAKEVAANAAKK